MTPTQLDIDYYAWLTSQIHIPNGKDYGDLFERMHNLEFVWTVPNDDNRVQDGLDLRYEFADSKKNNINLPAVTFLEVLVALSRRVAFTAGGDPKRWAWRLLKNLRLTKMSDPLTNGKVERINDILDAVIWRTYEPNGRGGFFPLKYSTEDQTKIEIWYQMNKYVIEMHGP
jgi:hypothetical protein